MRYWLAAAVMMAAIWWESSRTFDFPPGLPTFSDKIIHATCWAVLAALMALGALARRHGAKVAIAGAFVVAAAYGAVDEWHQSHVPGRDASLGDLAADATGALLGAALAAAYYRRHGDRS